MKQKKVKTLIEEIGHLAQHRDWVTAIEPYSPQNENADSQMFISSSRDKNILIWKIKSNASQPAKFAKVAQRLSVHSHFVSDLAVLENKFLLSASWDKSMRLWNLEKREQIKQFYEGGHDKEILSCFISNNGRFILSSGADKALKLWNSLGQCKHTVKNQSKITKIRQICTEEQNSEPFIAAGSEDGFLQIWEIRTMSIKKSLHVHEGKVEALSVSPKGKFIASGGIDMNVKLFQFCNLEKECEVHHVNMPVTCLAFNPRHDWLAIGTETKWEIWKFDEKTAPVILDGEQSIQKVPYQVTSINWNSLGNRLFVGHVHGLIKIYEFKQEFN